DWSSDVCSSDLLSFRTACSPSALSFRNSLHLAPVRFPLVVKPWSQRASLSLLSEVPPSIRTWSSHPGNLFRDPLRMGQPGARPPQHERLVAVFKGPNMVRPVFIHFGVRINEAELAPKQLEVVVLSGQEEPSWPHMKLLGVVL